MEAVKISGRWDAIQGPRESKLINAREGISEISINNHLVNLPAPFVDGVVKHNLTIILVDPDFSGANIFAYDENGNVVWKVQLQTFTIEKPGYELLEIYKGHLQAYCRDAWFEIDPKTGILISDDNIDKEVFLFCKTLKFSAKIRR